MMGSGGMIIMDSTVNMVEVAKYFMDFCVDESCGKCIPCRVGTKHIHHFLEKIANGEGTTDDFALLQDLCMMVKETSLCGLGQSAPNPVLSTIRFFGEEYASLLKEPAAYAGGNGHSHETAPEQV
jgi:bidirectional [NiFe] hydrogenase diaphorase subunit